MSVFLACKFYFTNSETINDVFLGKEVVISTLIPILLNEKIAYVSGG